MENYYRFRFIAKLKENDFSIILLGEKCFKLIFSTMREVYNENTRSLELLF